MQSKRNFRKNVAHARTFQIICFLSGAAGPSSGRPSRWSEPRKFAERGGTYIRKVSPGVGTVIDIVAPPQKYRFGSTATSWASKLHFLTEIWELLVAHNLLDNIIRVRIARLLSLLRPGHAARADILGRVLWGTQNSESFARGGHHVRDVWNRNFSRNRFRGTTFDPWR